MLRIKQKNGEKMRNVIDILKAVFSEMIEKKMLWGIKPVFNGYIDLEVNDPKMKDFNPCSSSI